MPRKRSRSTSGATGRDRINFPLMVCGVFGCSWPDGALAKLGRALNGFAPGLGQAMLDVSHLLHQLQQMRVT